MKISNFNFLFS